jgi:hypothetical protein
MSKSRCKGRSHSKRRTMRGGAGATSWAPAVYGGPGDQHAVSASDNTIAMNNVAGGMPTQSGGKRRRKSRSTSLFGKFKNMFGTKRRR